MHRHANVDSSSGGTPGKASSYSMTQTCQHLRFGENAADLDPIDFMQIYQAQEQNEPCISPIHGEDTQAFISGGSPAQGQELDDRALVLQANDDPWDYFVQTPMAMLGIAAPLSAAIPATPLLDAWPPLSTPNTKSPELKGLVQLEISRSSLRARQIQRRREQNCAAQRACRARKERYTRNLEYNYSKLVCRYNELIQVLQDLNIDHPGMIIQNNGRAEKQQDTGGDGHEDEQRENF